MIYCAGELNCHHEWYAIVMNSNGDCEKNESIDKAFDNIVLCMFSR